MPRRRPKRFDPEMDRVLAAALALRDAENEENVRASLAEIRRILDEVEEKLKPRDPNDPWGLRKILAKAQEQSRLTRVYDEERARRRKR